LSVISGVASRVQNTARTKTTEEIRMNTNTPRSLRTAILACICTTASSATLAAEKSADDWQYGVAIYGFFPEITGDARFPAGNGQTIDVSADDLIDHLKLATMFSLSAQKGRWGAFTDVIYLDVGDSISHSTAIGAGRMPLPPGITADGSLDIKGWVWTLAGSYRAFESRDAIVDVFGGARLLDMKGELDWSFSAPFPPFEGPFQSGDADIERHSWDGIVGAKGRVRFGRDGRWFVPWYADAGTGNSDFTYQVSTGLGYSADWGDLFLTWRYLRYDFGSERKFENLDFNGPAVGVAFHF
jgi:hypothetical protein